MDDEKEIQEKPYIRRDRNLPIKKGRVIVAKKDGKVLYTIAHPEEEIQEKE